MPKLRKKYDKAFKKCRKIVVRKPKTIQGIADDLGINVNLLCTWRKKYTQDSDKIKILKKTF